MPSFTTNSKANTTQKSDEDMFIDRPFFNRKHHENEYLKPFPYKSRYNDNISYMALSRVKCHAEHTS